MRLPRPSPARPPIRAPMTARRAHDEGRVRPRSVGRRQRSTGNTRADCPVRDRRHDRFASASSHLAGIPALVQNHHSGHLRQASPRRRKKPRARCDPLRRAGVTVGPARRWSTRPAFVVARASPRRLHGPRSARKARLSRPSHRLSGHEAAPSPEFRATHVHRRHRLDARRRRKAGPPSSALEIG